jgi:hypothetical protein
MTAIDLKYQSMGGASSFLGAPATPETACPDGVGRYRHYAHGSIYWTAATGAHEVHGLIRGKWSALGYEQGKLGYPGTDETALANGAYSIFQGGVILWKGGAAEAFAVQGAIQSRYVSLGSEGGVLGFPVTDERPLPDGVGRYNHFEGGSIYWKPSVGAHEVHGLIRGFWADHGWEQGSFGYPLTNEAPTHEGDADRFNDFENGVIYCKPSWNLAQAVVPQPDLSRSKAQVLAELKAKISGELLAADSRVYITSQPDITAVGDYQQIPSGVRNRMYTVATSFGITVEGSNDPDCDLTVTVEIRFDRPSNQIQAIVRGWSIHTEVDFPTTIAVTAAEVNAQLKPKLDALVDAINVLQTVGSLLRVLSLKVMPSGDLNLYLEPA